MIESITRKVWRSVPVRVVLIAADFTVVLVLNLLLILLVIKKIIYSKRIVILTEGGFGHTVMAPDIARRIFPDQMTLVIIFRVRGRDNRNLSKIWTDIHVIYLWRYLWFFNKIEHTPLLILLFGLKFLLRKKLYIATNDPEFKNDSRHAAWIEPECIYQLFVNQQIDCYGLISQPNHPSNEFLLYWVRNVFLNPMPQPRLPSAIDKRFMLRMENIEPERSGVLAVYMRKKGEGGDGLTRCGGTYEDYRPVFEVARKQGLMVLVLGDRSLEECPLDMREYLHDARSFNLDNSWYSLAAIIKCDYFVGDPGGGSLLPCLMEMPKIMINSFPYSQALPGFLHLFKRVTNSQGNYVSLTKCFNIYPWTYDFGSEYVLTNNTPAELTAVMDEMFSVHPSCWKNYISKSNFELMGSYTRLGARVCRAQCIND